MTRNNLTNQQLLKELEQRLPDFTQDEFTVLTRLLGNYNQEFFKSIQTLNSQVYQWTQEKNQQLEQQKTDQEIDQLKKSLDQK